MVLFKNPRSKLNSELGLPIVILPVEFSESIVSFKNLNTLLLALKSPFFPLIFSRALLLNCFAPMIAISLWLTTFFLTIAPELLSGTISYVYK